MGKRETVPVYVGGQFVRHVTLKQHAKEVAGKVLADRPAVRRRDENGFEYDVAFNRLARKANGPFGAGWHAYYSEYRL